MSATDSGDSGQPWAIVLAGGDGTRLRSLTVDRAGDIVPKQFCSLSGGVSLLAEAFARAESVVGRERITTVVAARHRRHWQPLLELLPSENVVVQPMNRGTGIGVLWPTLRILERDPQATILILPSDHHVGDEYVLETAMCASLAEVRDYRTGVTLLGIRPHEPDPELGYILPASTGRGTPGVERFVEKPPKDEARRLCALGALWNSFIVACRAEALVELYLSRYTSVVQSLRAARGADDESLFQIYCQLPELDFSCDVVMGQERRLTVMPVPRCGWNDLGTPRRLAQTLAQWREPPLAGALGWSSCAPPPVNLTERLTEGTSTFRTLLRQWPSANSTAAHTGARHEHSD